MNKQQEEALYGATRSMMDRVTRQVFEVFRQELANNGVEIPPFESMLNEKGKPDGNLFNAKPKVGDVVRAIVDHESGLLVAANSIETVESWDEGSEKKKSDLMARRTEAVLTLFSPKDGDA